MIQFTHALQRKRWCGWMVAFALLGCDVNTPVSKAPECIGGRNCLDASAIDSAEESVPRSDASAVVSSEPDAALAMICPGSCLPDDPAACLAPELLLQVAAEAGAIPAPGLVSDAAAWADAAGPEAGTSDRRDASDMLMTASDGNASGGSLDIGDAATQGESSSLQSDAASYLDAGAFTDSGAKPLDVLDAAGVGAGGPGQSVLSCQLVWDHSSLVAGCGISGTGGEGDACASTRDCSPGLGCVGAAQAGQCLPYCCGGQASCAERHYCAERPLRSPDITVGDAPLVPVCAVAEPCSLMLGPCTAGEPCSCPEDRACTVVDQAGTTACVEPGPGQEGDACPCAAGYFCSQVAKTCLKLCNTADSAPACGQRACQPGPSGFPKGWGLCVGQ